MAAARREHRRVLRLKIDNPLKVVMGSIGDEIRYEMFTHNISYTGFFLSFDKPGRFPFTQASIMEVWLELEPGRPIFFNGKMARIVYPDEAAAAETGPGIAIRIVQISPEQDLILKQFIDRNLKERNAPKDNGSAA